MTESRLSGPAPDLLPTVVLEHARTGQPIIVDLKDYLAGRDERFANWRLLAHGDVIPPPPLRIDAYPELGSPVQVTEAGGIERTLARPEKGKSERTKAGAEQPSGPPPGKRRRRGGKYGRQA